MTDDKRKTIEILLEEKHMFIHLNPSEEGVVLPEHLMNEPVVTLKLSRFFSHPLKILPEELHIPLSFDDGVFSCQIPFAAILGATGINGSTFLWDQNLPELFQVQKDLEKKIYPEEKTKEPVKKKREKKKSHLKLIK